MTNDIELARRIARHLYTGGVFINGVTASDPRVPVGGVKNSGYGRELSHFGAHAFVNAQTVWIESHIATLTVAECAASVIGARSYTVREKSKSLAGAT